MAFTEVEVKEAHDAAMQSVDANDLFKLGLMYSTDLEDRGPDFVEAHKWFNLAAMMGSIPAKAYREEVTLEMSAEDRTLALKAARKWMRDNHDALERAKAVRKAASEREQDTRVEAAPVEAEATIAA